MIRPAQKRIRQQILFDVFASDDTRQLGEHQVQVNKLFNSELARNRQRLADDISLP